MALDPRSGLPEPGQRCKACIDRHDGFYGSWAAPCPIHDDDGNLRPTWDMPKVSRSLGEAEKELEEARTQLQATKAQDELVQKQEALLAKMQDNLDDAAKTIQKIASGIDTSITMYSCGLQEGYLGALEVLTRTIEAFRKEMEKLK